ncbi:MAG: cation acetate symporter [Archaeoglobaceae archaeon]|nr:cation acetate symporter [Archaeoglobaceae archaeon]MDW7989851.1 cation acetate symporter [Archaeoglobaceae archaeon]
MAGSVDPIVIIIVAIYLIAVVVIGYYSRVRLKSAMDYYVAGRRLGSIVNGLALESTYLSPASMLGLPAFIFLLGYPFWWAMVAIICGMPLATLLTASALRKYAPVSFADYYADRYGDERLRWWIGIIVIVGTILYITLSLVGMALFMVAILKMPYFIALVIGTIITMFYVVYGGMIATSWNAAMQALVMSFAAIIAAIAIVWQLGGLEGVYIAAEKSYARIWNSPANAPEVSHIFTGTWIGVIGWYFVWHLGFATMPYTVVRFFTVMDIKTARRSIFWCALIAGAFYVSLQLIGITAKYMIEKSHPIAVAAGGNMSATAVLASIQRTYGIGTVTDYSMIAAVEALGNPVILGILCAGGLAIAMSTAAGWAVVVNTVIARDWMVKLLKSKKAEEKPILYGRIVAFIFLLISFIIAIQPPALVLDLSGWAFIVIICSIGPGLILGLWWKRATKAAMWFTAIVMFVVSMIAWMRAYFILGHHARFFLNDIIFGNPNALITPHQIWTVPLGFILFIIVSLLTKPPEEERVQKYCVELTKEV